MRLDRPLTTFHMLMLLVIGACTMQVAMWAMDRDPPIHIVSSVAVDAVPQGGNARIQYVVERYRSCPFKVDRDIITSQEVRIELRDSDWGAAPGPMGRETYYVDVPVPISVSPGVARYRTILQYQCNLFQILRPLVVRTETPFSVYAPDKP